MDAKTEKAHRITAMMIAVAVRDTMEDFHHKYLSDDQMRELNPLVRNAIYTVLIAGHESGENVEGADDYLRSLRTNIPPYWENPTLLPAYLGFRGDR